MTNRLIDFNPEGDGVDEAARLFTTPSPRPVTASDEVAELEYASAFLDASDPACLAKLVSQLIQFAGRGTGRPIDPLVVRALAPRLGRAASIIWRLLPTRKITPADGQTEFATTAAERMFGAEFEGLSGEDQEFETARYYVRFALDAARSAAMLQSGRSPATVAAVAERMAARRHAPGLLGAIAPTYPGFRMRRVVRRRFV